MNKKQYNDIESNLSIRICKMQGHDLGDSTPENKISYDHDISGIMKKLKCKRCLGTGFESGIDDMSDLIPFPCSACGVSKND